MMYSMDENNLAGIKPGKAFFFVASYHLMLLPNRLQAEQPIKICLSAPFFCFTVPLSLMSSV